MTTLAIGQKAERVAADYLGAQDYDMLAQNWRTRYCEIDLVVRKDGVIYFVEVKYRRTATHGSGLDAVGNSKLRQMRFAAHIWVHRYDWAGTYCLAIIAVTGADFCVTDFVKVTT